MKNRYEVRGDVTAIFLNGPKYGHLETLIDTKDLPKAKAIPGTWSAINFKKYSVIYAIAKVERDGKKKSVLLHRYLTDAPVGLEVDHKNGNGLDNCRSENLRVCTTAENQQNRRGAQRNSKSGVRGVSWRKKEGRWLADLTINGKKKYIGLFRELEEAKEAASNARKQYMPFSEEA